MVEFVICSLQVSSVTDHIGAQDSGAKAADFDDDDGGGLVSPPAFNIRYILKYMLIDICNNF